MRNLALFIPLGVLGVLRWASWLIRRIPAVLYEPYGSGHQEPLTVVTPVYQEDPEIFREALRSWLANDIAGVIAVIDSTDTVAVEVAAEFGDAVDVIITDVPGKRDALRLGWERARTPLVALVDSDTLWATDVAIRVSEPFADPTIGGVGTRQNVYNPTSVWQRLNDIYLDFRYADEVAGQSHWGRAVSCLSGRTAVYRRDILLEISEDFMNEKFMGVQANSGEDKRLTMLTLERGYSHYLQQNARVWSTFPSDGSTFFKQRLRWARNTWRSDLRALFGGWVFRHKYLSFTLMDKALSAFTLLVSPIYLGIAIVSGQWLVVGALLVWWLISRTAKYFPHLVRQPRDVLLMPVVIVMSFALALVKIGALLTIRKQKWLTRDVAVVNNKIVRTPGPSRSATPDVSTAGAMVRHPRPSREGARWHPPLLGVVIIGALLLGAGSTIPMIRIADEQCLLPDDGFPEAEVAEDGRTRSPWVANRVVATGCEWGPDVRAIVVTPDEIVLQAGGNVERTITFSSNEQVRLEDLSTIVDDPAWLEEVEPTIYELKATLYQQPGTKLLAAGPLVSELRLLDAPYLFIGGNKAEAEFREVKVSSWTGDDYDVDPEDGRPFILYENGSTLDISGPNSEFTHLGSDRRDAYGVAWTGSNTRGVVSDTTFAQNFYGVYVARAQDLTLANNIIRDNQWYGVSAHVDGELLATGNDIHQNGGHGIDLSNGVTAAVLDMNHVHANEGHGILLRQGSNENTVKNNVVEANTLDGIVLAGSGENQVVSNDIRGNRVGVRVAGEGSNVNTLKTNTITGNERGIEVFGGATAAQLEQNEVLETVSTGIRLDAADSRSVNDRVNNAPVGFDVRSAATIDRPEVDDVSIGLIVRSTEEVVINDPEVTAREIAIRVDRRASATLTGGQISAPIPIKGSEAIPVGDETKITTSAPPGLPIFGLIGVLFLLAAIILEFVRRRGVKLRGDNDTSIAPEVVWNTAP